MTPVYTVYRSFNVLARRSDARWGRLVTIHPRRPAALCQRGDGGHVNIVVWPGLDGRLATHVREQSGRWMAAYRENPLLVAQDGAIEISTAEGGYGRKQLYELIQNGADALVGRTGRISVVLVEDTLYCANQGAPLTLQGVHALMTSHMSIKRGTEIGRFGLGVERPQQPDPARIGHGLLQAAQVLRVRGHQQVRERLGVDPGGRCGWCHSRARRGFGRPGVHRLPDVPVPVPAMVTAPGRARRPPPRRPASSPRSGSADVPGTDEHHGRARHDRSQSSDDGSEPGLVDRGSDRPSVNYSPGMTPPSVVSGSARAHPAGCPERGEAGPPGDGHDSAWSRRPLFRSFRASAVRDRLDARARRRTAYPPSHRQPSPRAVV